MQFVRWNASAGLRLLRSRTGASPLATVPRSSSGLHLALPGLLADHPPARIIRRAPLADILDVPKTADTNFLLVQPAKAHTRRRHGRADVAVQRLGGAYRSGLLRHDQISSKSRSTPTCFKVNRARISLSFSSLFTQNQ